MTQMPPPPGYPNQPNMPYPGGPMPTPPRTNGMAIASLICGILGCFPVVITGLLAIVFGVLGMNKAKEPGVGGKGLAISGIILGVIGILWSAGFIGTAFWGYGMAKKLVLAPTQQVGGAFINSLASGDTAKAASYTTGDMSPTELSSLGDKIKGYGSFKDFTIASVNANKSIGETMSVTIGGKANFQSGSKDFTATFSGNPKQPATYKISSFTLE